MKPGCDDQSGRVENVRLFGNGLAAIEQTNNTAIFNQHASTTGVNLLRRIDHVTICNQQLHSWFTLRSRFCFLAAVFLQTAPDGFHPRVR